MKKSEFQAMINEAVALAIKRLFVDTDFLDSLLVDAEQRFTKSIKEVITAANVARPAAKKRSVDEIDFNFEEDNEDEKIQKVQAAAETILERQGKAIRDALGGFNPFTESTMARAIEMQGAPEVPAASESQGARPLSMQDGVNPELPVVPNNFVEVLAKNSGFKNAVANIKPASSSRFEETEEEASEEPSSKRVSAKTYDTNPILENTANELYGNFD